MGVARGFLPDKLQVLQRLQDTPNTSKRLRGSIGGCRMTRRVGFIACRDRPTFGRTDSLSLQRVQVQSPATSLSLLIPKSASQLLHVGIPCPTTGLGSATIYLETLSHADYDSLSWRTRRAKFGFLTFFCSTSPEIAAAWQRQCAQNCYAPVCTSF